MMKEKATVEVHAPTVEEAIEQGLDQLGLPRTAVDVEILEEGHQGFLGLGNQDARVRLIVKDEKPTPPKPVKQKPAPIVAISGKEEPTEEMDQIEINKNSAVEIVRKLVSEMSIEARVSGRVIDPEDERDHPMVQVEITGNDLSILIGRRSETLNALQYIASLILCEKAKTWIPLTIDVQGYRSRRERQLRQLARRLADQVVQTGRKQVLEAMPANERRIIHLELRYHPFVTTTSIGEEPNRRTTIILKPK